MDRRPPPPAEPWVSRRHWRRLAAARADGRITRAELDALKRRVARVRAGPLEPSAPVRPLLRLLPGGARPFPELPTPFTPTPLEAA